MKKYSDRDFKKKFNVLSDRLQTKEGFKEAVQETRIKLGIPKDGFSDEAELAEFLIKKMSKEEQKVFTFLAFVESYAHQNKIVIDDNNRKEVTEAFLKKGYSGGISMVAMMFELIKGISDHNNFITQYPLFKKDKHLSKLFPEMIKICKKFWGIDMLDQPVMTHMVEKYLFLGNSGINSYIQKKILCPTCRYMGIEHFSPERHNMLGQDKGAFSKDYIFNEATVRRLSAYFDSVFIIIRPYSNKEEVISYIEDNWDSLKWHVTEKNKFYEQMGYKGSRVRESDIEKNQLIYELYKLSKKELLKKYNGQDNLSLPGIYKESIISRILSEEYQIEMTPDAIKKSATRFAKSILVKNKPKDIRDI